MLNKLVLTGAAGRLGSYLRQPLSQKCSKLVSTDIVNVIDNLYENETFHSANLENLDEMTAIFENADVVVHFGAHADEAPFEKLLGPNFIGAYNVWQAAKKNKVKRIIYASSIHAVGMYDKNKQIDSTVPHRPDTFYGLSKCFAEDLARMYWEKCKIESICLRILSCAQVTSQRALGTWLSYNDLIQLVLRSIDTVNPGFTIVYGVSNNDRCPVNNMGASYLGFRPKDNAEDFAEKILSQDHLTQIDKSENDRHGGPFAATNLGESGLAKMTIIDDKKKN